MRIGIDWGGTKIELGAFDDHGDQAFRERIATPQDDYGACIQAVVALVSRAEEHLGQLCSIGIGIPGTLSPASGLVKNANSVWLNGKPLKQDLESRLSREVRIQNDANCMAVSEATDGAGHGHRTVAGIILGTGCGCGLAIDGKAHTGHQGIAGEFGHTPLPWMGADEYPGEMCWCGRRGCLETWISGTGFCRDYQRRSGEAGLRKGEEILLLDTATSRASYADYCDRLARGLAVLVNIVDPDIIILGGGMSLVEELYVDVPPLMASYVFSDGFETPIVAAQYGDASGVRGAAWLWPR